MALQLIKGEKQDCAKCKGRDCSDKIVPNPLGGRKMWVILCLCTCHPPRGHLRMVGEEREGTLSA